MPKGTTYSNNIIIVHFLSIPLSQSRVPWPSHATTMMHASDAAFMTGAQHADQVLRCVL